MSNEREQVAVSTTETRGVMASSTLVDAIRQQNPLLSGTEVAGVVDALTAEIGRRLNEGSQLAFLREREGGDFELSAFRINFHNAIESKESSNEIVPTRESRIHGLDKLWGEDLRKLNQMSPSERKER